MDARSSDASTPDPKLVIPGDPQRIAEETARVSPEGRPAEADAKMGPKALRLEILALWALVLVLAVCLGYFVNPFAGVVAFALGTIGLMFNPVVNAAEQRAEERAPIADRRAPKIEPGDVVVNTTSRRKRAGV